MPYDLSVPDGANYVQIKWHGHATSTEMERSGVEALTFAAEKKIWKVLIDVTELESCQDTIDLFSQTVAHSRLDPPGPRAALLGRADQEADLRFIENVGSNRGMLLKVFRDLQAAVEWLST